MDTSKNNITALRERLYHKMVLIRRFEQRLFELFALGELAGTTHACIGQEAIAAAVTDHLASEDIVVSNHRCHGHYLAKTGDATGLLAELMGKTGGICQGRGGSQHLCGDNFYTNGVQGNMVPVAAGMAYAEKRKKTGAIATLFIGDGTMGQGIVYETFNLISLWNIPLLIVIENNQYAQTTPLRLNFAGDFCRRAQAFALSAGEVESNDAELLHKRFAGLIHNVRAKGKPHVEVVHTYRYCPHSTGNDFRNPEEIDTWREKDPLMILGNRIDASTCRSIEEKAANEITNSEITAREMPLADWSTC